MLIFSLISNINKNRKNQTNWMCMSVYNNYLGYCKTEIFKFTQLYNKLQYIYI